ncbi:TetR family transcriptional regulator [Amycolatopsis sp. H6(2020)]|nr:TetR family transcriptional regulator [Amycolatopsis sp. H6(2020)]
MRETARAEVVTVALKLFAEQGFDGTTVDQIATEAGLSRASLFRYFGTKEDIVLGQLAETGRTIAEALAARPEEERPWEALRRAFDVLVEDNAETREQTLAYLRMLYDTPSLRARHHEKQLSWQNLLVPEIARRLGAEPALSEDPGPSALAASALACMDTATVAWLACDGTVPSAALLDRAMDAVANT